MSFYECKKCGAIPGVTACCTDKVKSAEQWQPIETAPKDGTWIMAYRPPCEGIQMDTILMVSWQPFDDEGSAWMWPDAPYDLTTEAGRTAALRLIEKGNPYWDESFTHWMPLPVPPIPGPVEP